MYNLIKLYLLNTHFTSKCMPYKKNKKNNKFVQKKFKMYIIL